MTTLIVENRVFNPPSAHVVDGALWLNSTDAKQILGPSVSPAAGDESGQINLTDYSRDAKRALLNDSAAGVWVLGSSATNRGEALMSLDAPDFSLPDLAGNQHSLSEYRGRKVFLFIWSSW